MSQENAEAVRGLFQRLSTGDFLSAEVASALDPHVVFVVRPPFPEEGVVLGLEALANYLRGFFEQWERLTMEADSLQAIGDTILARVVQHAKGKASGVGGDIRFCMLFTFRGGKIVRIESLLDEAEALEAAGLRE